VSSPGRGLRFRLREDSNNTVNEARSRLEGLLMDVRCLVVAFAAPLLVAGRAAAFPVALQDATATFSQDQFSVASAIEGSSVTTGWAIYPDIVDQTAVFETSADLFAAAGTLTFTLMQLLNGPPTLPPQHLLGRFRLSVTTDPRDTFADGLANGGDVTTNWTVLDPTSIASANGVTFTKLSDFSILAGGPTPNTDVYTVTASTTLSGITGIRLEMLENASLPFSGPGRQPTNGNFVLTHLAVDAMPVPEPSRVALLCAGLLALGLWGGLDRRRGRAARGRTPSG